MRYTISRMPVLVARRGFLHLVAKGRTHPTAEKEPVSAHPVKALLPSGQPDSQNKQRTRRIWDKDELRPSQSRLSRRLRMVLTKYAMLLCLAAALICTLSVPLLSSIKVGHISVEGAVRCDAEQVTSLCGVSVGDEMYAHDVDDIAARVKAAYPQLRAVTVKRERGGFTIVLTESTPRWALLLTDGRVALVDDDGYMSEICERSQTPEGVCLLDMQLPMLPPNEEDGDMQEQIATAGQYIKGSSPALALVERLSDALDEVPLHAPPAMLDLGDIYAVTLTLEDGTQLLLHECRDAMRQLQRAKGALDSYFLTHPVTDTFHTLRVDVDDFLRVSIRAVPKTGQEQAENTQNPEN